MKAINEAVVFLSGQLEKSPWDASDYQGGDFDLYVGYDAITLKSKRGTLGGQWAQWDDVITNAAAEIGVGRRLQYRSGNIEIVG